MELNKKNRIQTKENKVKKIKIRLKEIDDRDFSNMEAEAIAFYRDFITGGLSISTENITKLWIHY